MQKQPNRLERLQEFHNSNPKDTFVLFALAKEYEKMGEDKVALKHYLQLLETDKNYVGAYYHLGKLYERFGQIEEAFSTYKIGMEVAKSAGDQLALRELAGAKMEIGDDEDF